MKIFSFLLFITLIGSNLLCKSSKTNADQELYIEPQSKVEQTNPESDYVNNQSGDKIKQVILTDEEWQKKLTPEQYKVLRKKGTERAFSCGMWEIKDNGLYACAGCDQVLFTSSAKFDSGTGWPSFFRPDDKNMIVEATDNELGFERTEVLCARCGGHLGHVFDDGPPPTGMRYCINSVSLYFIEAKNNK